MDDDVHVDGGNEEFEGDDAQQGGEFGGEVFGVDGPEDVGGEAVLEDARAALRRFFGFEEFRDGQAEVISKVLEGRDGLVVMPTGGGKSLCYQLPALVLEGVTVVVSPLIALMQDQVDALLARGVAVTMINSMVSGREQMERMEALERGEYKLVYVAPERFRSRRFVAALLRVKVALFAVDEAHCLSQWGHDFRPDYMRLGDAAQQIGRPPVLALTATATGVVRDDIRTQLRMREDGFSIVRGFARPNLALRVLDTRSREAKFTQLARVVEAHGTGIVYCATRKRVEEVEAELRGKGITCTAYHAGLSEGQRRERQEMFLQREVGVVVATNAFGMGIDRADLRFIVHFDLPGSVEAYYQEVGRAGRDGKDSVAELYFSYADTRTQEFFIEGSNPSEALIRQLYRKLVMLGDEQGELMMSMDELKEEMGERNGMAVNSAMSQLMRERVVDRFDVQGSRMKGTRVVGPSRAEDVELDVVGLEAKEARDRERLRQMLAFAQGTHCRQQWILEYFGEKGAKPCGCCDACREGSADEMRAPDGEQRLLVRKVLAGVARSCVCRGNSVFEGGFGKRKVVAMLRGSEAQDVLDAGLGKLSTYGMLKGEAEDFLLSLMDALVRAGLLVVQGTEYPLVALSERGDRVMRDEGGEGEEFEMLWPARKTGRKRPAAGKKGRAGAQQRLAGADYEVFRALTRLRTEMAAEAGVPAYVVFPNKVLEGMAEMRPQTVEQAMEIAGIGPAKAQQWLEPFLRLLEEY